MNTHDLPDLVPVHLLIEWSGLGRSTVYEAIRRGDLPSIRVGRRIFVPKPALLTRLGLTGEGVHRDGN